MLLEFLFAETVRDEFVSHRMAGRGSRVAGRRSQVVEVQLKRGSEVAGRWVLVAGGGGIEPPYLGPLPLSQPAHLGQRKENRSNYVRRFASRSLHTSVPC